MMQGSSDAFCQVVLETMIYEIVDLTAPRGLNVVSHIEVNISNLSRCVIDELIRFLYRKFLLNFVALADDHQTFISMLSSAPVMIMIIDLEVVECLGGISLCENHYNYS